MCSSSIDFFSRLLVVVVFIKLIDSLDAAIPSPGDGHLRFRRETEENSSIRGVYNANKTSQFVELTLVIHKNSREQTDAEIKDIFRRYKYIVNIVNSLFQPLNLFVALIDIKQWPKNIETVEDPDIEEILNRFKKYIRSNLSVEKEYENLDHIQLVSVVSNSSGCSPLPHYASMGEMCSSSVGAILDFKENENHAAGYLARILARSLNMRRNTEECIDQTKGCIKWDKFKNTRQWLESNACIDQSIAAVRKKKLYSCLNNQPNKLFEGPTCGNSFIESGEDCDCGFGQCNNPCCDPMMCKKHSTARCAFGECCDLESCMFTSSGTICRSAKHSCDLDEYCNHKSEFCPIDVFKNIGENCFEECDNSLPKCSGTATVCSSYGKNNGVCDSGGQCKCPDNRQHDHPDKDNGSQKPIDRENRKLRDVLSGTFLLVGALLLLFILLFIIIRKRSSRRSQTESKVEYNPYFIRNIDEITLPPPRDAFYCLPNDNLSFNTLSNANYAMPIDKMHPLPALSSSLLSIRNTESTESWPSPYHSEDEYATIYEDAKPNS